MQIICNVTFLIGWISCSGSEVNGHSSRLKGEELLKLSVGADPAAYQSWYFLGRCHAKGGRDGEAFMAYQQALGCCREPEGLAGIYISIG